MSARMNRYTVYLGWMIVVAMLAGVTLGLSKSLWFVMTMVIAMTFAIIGNLLAIKTDKVNLVSAILWFVCIIMWFFTYNIAKSVAIL